MVHFVGSAALKLKLGRVGGWLELELEREVGAARERFGDGASAKPRVAWNGDTMVGTDDEGRKGLADEARSLRLWGGRVVSRRGMHGLGSRGRQR